MKSWRATSDTEDCKSQIPCGVCVQSPKEKVSDWVTGNEEWYILVTFLKEISILGQRKGIEEFPK